MRNVWKQVITTLLLLAGCASLPRPAGDIKLWAAYYDKALPAKTFKDYDLVIFDRRHYPKFETLKGKTIVLAYVSIGEVYDDVPEKKTLEKENAILFHNDTWNSHAVDISSPQWRRLVLGYVDDAAKKGFDGVMLDTIDSPLYWAANQAPQRVAAMQDSAVSLIQAIRTAHPTMKIMLNRGFELLPALGGTIDYILAESILTNRDDSTGQFEINSSHSYDQVATQLHRFVAKSPQTQVLTLDYWNMDDVNGLATIYAHQRAEGFIPYVTTADLTTHTPEPRPTRRKH